MSEKDLTDFRRQLSAIARDIQEIKLANKEIQISIGGSIGNIGLSRRVEELERKAEIIDQLKWKIFGASAVIGAVMGVLIPLIYYFIEKGL